MIIFRSFLTLFSLAVMFIISCEHLPLTSEKAGHGEKALREGERDELRLGLIGGEMVIANRASGSISVIDVTTDEVSGTYKLPGNTTGEPMYAVYTLRNQTVFVGDRANDQIVAFDAGDYSVKTTIPAGDGVFHMWADPRGKQLWVNNDVDKTVTVIDPSTYSVITTFSIPEDLIDAGGKPHDVILDPTGRLAYISVLGLSGDSDYVVQYNTHTFREMGRAAVGKDPHLSLTQKNSILYVPCQNSDAVYVLDRYSMEIQEVLEVPGAHGAGMPLQGKTFYTTNLPGGGPAGLWSIDVATNSVLAHTDTPQPIPHNIALTPEGSKLYITHSGGTSNLVSVYSIARGEQVPEFQGTIEVGLNPFGLTYAR